MSDNDENRRAIKKPKDPQVLKDAWAVEVKKRLAAMQAFDPNATLMYRLNSESGSIDYMVGDDLAAQLAINGPLYEKSKQFVQSWSDLICLQEELSASKLSLKMPLRSSLGDHLILESRIADGEEPTKSFALHFDHNERLVFFTAIYQPYSVRDPGAFATMTNNQAKIEDKLAALRAGRLLPMEPLPIQDPEGKPIEVALKTELQWLPNQSRISYPYLQVKYKAARQDWVLYIDHNSEIVSCRESCSGAGFRVAPIVEQFWAKSSPPETEGVTANSAKPRRVVLRDLTTSGSFAPLQGTYVRVYDHINDVSFNEWKLLEGLPFTSAEGQPSIVTMFDSVNHTQSDRILAYYHIDLIQRYFRTLGLTVLDNYAELNPLEVHLGAGGKVNTTSSYLHESKSLVFPQIQDLGTKGCTQARSPHIIYHEYVHAVTDAIARLGRGRAIQRDDAHYRQILQAKALDEGIADYFACSFAERHGAQSAQVGELMALKKGNQHHLQLLPNTRELEPSAQAEPTQESIKNDFDALLDECVTAFRTSGDITNEKANIYRLSTLWSQFLWRFRKQVDCDVADMLIANSIFFLSRWATFGLALQALLTADRLLFNSGYARVLGADPAFSAFQDWESAQQDLINNTSDGVVSTAVYSEAINDVEKSTLESARTRGEAASNLDSKGA